MTVVRRFADMHLFCKSDLDESVHNVDNDSAHPMTEHDLELVMSRPAETFTGELLTA